MQFIDVTAKKRLPLKACLLLAESLQLAAYHYGPCCRCGDHSAYFGSGAAFKDDSPCELILAINDPSIEALDPDAGVSARVHEARWAELTIVAVASIAQCLRCDSEGRSSQLFM